jgi:hypothetical protein
MKMSKRIFKPAVTLFVMSVMLFSGSLWPSVQGAAGARPISNVASPLKVSVTLTFGRASRGCRGFGLCKLTLGVSRASADERNVRAELSTAGEGQEQLQLTLVDNPPEEGRTLYIDQDIPLSAETAKQLGFKSGTIQRGEYAFSENKSLLTARLTR